jgi:hypothetical protein
MPLLLSAHQLMSFLSSNHLILTPGIANLYISISSDHFVHYEHVSIQKIRNLRENFIKIDKESNQVNPTTKAIAFNYKPRLNKLG